MGGANVMDQQLGSGRSGGCPNVTSCAPLIKQKILLGEAGMTVTQVVTSALLGLLLLCASAGMCDMLHAIASSWQIGAFF
jgi:hypothetical protein